MKRIIVLCLIVLLLGSCTKYNNLYEVKPSSNNITLVRGYEYEDETVKIKYIFWGQNGSMYFSFFNKLDIPIYIDWKKSSLVRNTQKSDYWADEVNTKSKTKSSNVGYSSLLYYGVFDFMNFSSSTSVSASQSVKPERITFLAPKSSITRIQYNLFFLPPASIGKSAVKSTLNNPYNKTIVPVKYEEFTNQTTPFTFRNFITISTTESFNKEIYIDNEFFLYRIYKVKRNYFDPVFAFNPESKKKENVNILADSKRFYIKL